jgi:enoyl-CoA hydratase
MISYELREKVAVITMDDGKANALSPALIEALNAALDRAEGEAAAVLLIGREKRLSAGFDLGVMTRSLVDMRALVLSGAELLLRLYLFPRPVVVACTGHALAAGAILLLVADTRIGASGDFKIGLNEVAIQMTLPVFAVELARDRLSKRHFSAATTQAKIFDPHAAHDAGYLDRVVPAGELFQTAFEQARQLADLPDPAFHNTKQRARGATVQRIRETLEADIAQLGDPGRQ